MPSCRVPYIHSRPLRRMTKSGPGCRGEEHSSSSPATSPAPVTPFRHQNTTNLLTKLQPSLISSSKNRYFANQTLIMHQSVSKIHVSANKCHNYAIVSRISDFGDNQKTNSKNTPKPAPTQRDGTLLSIPAPYPVGWPLLEHPLC